EYLVRVPVGADFGGLGSEPESGPDAERKLHVSFDAFEHAYQAMVGRQVLTGPLHPGSLSHRHKVRHTKASGASDDGCLQDVRLVHIAARAAGEAGHFDGTISAFTLVQEP